MTSDDSSLSCFLEDDATEKKVCFASTCFDRCMIEANKNSQTASAYVRKVAREQIVGIVGYMVQFKADQKLTQSVEFR